ncbi:MULTISPECIES: hypothetical protein [unclassified Carboxylicivirga]|uniref:hypothetical protein n=1 Tax=Carboxylicivirga TaxID=1628153 RepID=UPI003D32C9D5
MKFLINIFVVFALGLGFVSCSNDDDEVFVDPTLDVNYANMAGTWRLSEWNGEKMDGDTRYYYITLDRFENGGTYRYEIYTNLNSFVSEHITGTYQLGETEDMKPTISGTFDYTLTGDDAWLYDYLITELYETSVKWTATDDAEEVRVYTRCSEVPADIVNGIQF